MTAIIWKLFKNKLIKYLQQEQNRPVGFEDLHYAFIDSEGMRYFRFPKNTAIPVDRYGKLTQYATYMDARLTAQNIDDLIDKGIEIIEEGIKQDKGHARIAAILYQIKDREDRIIPHELIYNYLAIQFVREDEHPQKFNNEIHMKKVEQFMKDAADSSSFFFALPEYKKLWSSATMSPNEWESYINVSESQETLIKESLKIYSS